jgi:predicted dehydrogenase
MARDLIGTAIIGCGNIGRKRARHLRDARLVACADARLENARQLAIDFPDAAISDDWQRTISLPDVDLVIVATPHNLLAEVTESAIQAGKHVLVEKPGARDAIELERILRLAERADTKVHVGYNHRFHPAIRKARELFLEGAIGEPMFIRARYGHGGRTGYADEWRADPRQSGGGELIDQGVHLIDLARWFLGEFVETTGFIHTYFWNSTVEDNVFMLLATSEKRVAHLHASWTEWKNLFSLEIYGKTGKLHAEGLGGSYGPERLAFHRMLPGMGPPETVCWEYPDEDDSWAWEFADVVDSIRQNRPPSVSLIDALAVLRIVGSIYRENDRR